MKKPTIPTPKDPNRTGVYLSLEARRSLKNLRAEYPGVSASHLISLAIVEYEKALSNIKEEE